MFKTDLHFIFQYISKHIAFTVSEGRLFIPFYSPRLIKETCHLIFLSLSENTYQEHTGSIQMDLVKCKL